MKIVTFALACLALFPFPLLAETNLWSRIRELSGHGTPQGALEREAFLRTLSPAQMLQAAREYCELSEVNVQKEDRDGESVGPVGVALGFYGNQDGSLSDDALNTLLGCIESGKEGEVFRESLLLLLRQRYWMHLTEKQRNESKEVFFALLSDDSAPTQLRVWTCREIELAIADEYRRVTYTDKNVSAVNNKKLSWSDRDDLIRSGEIHLDPETKQSWKAIRTEIERILPKLSALSNDSDVSPNLKAMAQHAIESFTKLPLMTEE